jgi:uncharacterized membrane protein YgaE (UPF0421/DUF939 family)
MNSIYVNIGCFIAGLVVMYFIRYKVIREAKRVKRQYEDAKEAVKDA